MQKYPFIYQRDEVFGNQSAITKGHWSEAAEYLICLMYNCHC